MSRKPGGSAVAALEIRDLFHRFGDRVAVDHLSATVGAGEIVGLVGRNGAGKTTTMRAVMGILDPLAGTLLWAGHQIGLEDRLRFGYMPEERGPVSPDACHGAARVLRAAARDGGKHRPRASRGLAGKA